jgi:4-amino-4-deoxychorismate lyase
VILINGKPNDRVDALDRGLAYGDGVFRTMRATRGQIPYWLRHHRKLASDCAALAIVCPAEDLLRAELAEILSTESECILKVIITRGAGGRGYAPPVKPSGTRIIASFPLPKISTQIDHDGVRAIWCQTRLAIQPRLAGIKHLNRLENVLARSEWSDPQIAEGLMLDTAGRVIEGTASNLFILEGERLVTPDLRGCGVAGVQRERIIEVAGRAGMVCSVEEVTRERICDAKQILLVNSVVGLRWVSALGDLRWQQSWQTAAIRQALDDLAD